MICNCLRIELGQISYGDLVCTSTSAKEIEAIAEQNLLPKFLFAGIPGNRNVLDKYCMRFWLNIPNVLAALNLVLEVVDQAINFNLYNLKSRSQFIFSQAFIL